MTTEAGVEPRIVVEGESCWRQVRASRVAFLVDGAAYFEAFAAAAERARRSIIILAWDIHSRVRLHRDGRHELPAELGKFLHALLARRPDLLMVPVTALIVAATLVFGPFLGFVYALLGTLASAGIAYAIGRALSRGALGWIAGRRHRLSPRLARRSLRAVTQGRLVRVAPLVGVSLSAGAAGIGFRTFAQRALLTLVPGVLVMSLLVDRFAHAAREPGLGTIASSFALLTLLVLVGLWLKRRLATAAGERVG